MWRLKPPPISETAPRATTDSSASSTASIKADRSGGFVARINANFFSRGLQLRHHLLDQFLRVVDADHHALQIQRGLVGIPRGRAIHAVLADENQRISQG